MHRGYSDVLRDAPEPMTADLVERVALDCWIATEAPVAATLLCGVQGDAGQDGQGGVLVGSGKPPKWSVRPKLPFVRSLHRIKRILNNGL